MADAGLLIDSSAVYLNDVMEKERCRVERETIEWCADCALVTMIFAVCYAHRAADEHEQYRAQ